MAIISHKHKLIIARPTKTGSSSFHASIVLSGMLGEQDMFSKLDVLSKLKHEPKLYWHWTPHNILRRHYVTEDQFNEYEIITTIRHPLERYISAFFFMAHLRKSSNNINVFKNLIRSKGAAIHDTKLGSKQSEYFKHNGEFIKNLIVVPTHKINVCVSDLINTYGGVYKEPQKLKTQMKPDWAKPHYSTWLSSADIKILKALLMEEIEIYYHVRANNEYQF